MLFKQFQNQSCQIFTKGCFISGRHLPQGEFTFEVIAESGDGIVSRTPATLKIVVHPPFWRTWWFRLVCALIVGLIVYAVFRFRIAGLQRARLARQDFSRRLINAHESECRRSVSDIVVTAQGRGIGNVVITMIDSSGGARTAMTTSFGYYRFAEVAAGRNLHLHGARQTLFVRANHAGSYDTRRHKQH